MKSYSISQRNKSRGSQVWYGREYEGGLLIKEISLKTTSKKDAKAWLDMMNVQRFLPESMVRSIGEKGMTVTKAVNEYLDMESSHVGEGFLENITICLKQFRMFCNDNGIENMERFTKRNAEEWYASMEISESTKRNKVTMVKSFFSWAIDTYNIVMKNPFEHLKMAKIVKRQKSFWTDEEVECILDSAASPVERLFFAVLAFTGLRHFEAVQFGPGLIVDGRIRIVGKGNKEAFLPISDRLLEEMSKVDVVDGMFRKYRDNCAANIAIRKAVAKAGMDTEQATCHKFRHSFCSNLFRTHKVTAVQVSKLARHSNVSTTVDIYSHLIDDDLTEAINAKREG